MGCRVEIVMDCLLLLLIVMKRGREQMGRKIRFMGPRPELLFWGGSGGCEC
jgi:hypothetical protein